MEPQKPVIAKAIRRKKNEARDIPLPDSKLYYKNGYKNELPAVAQVVKNLPPMQETQIQFLGREDPLEKGMATHSSILA